MKHLIWIIALGLCACDGDDPRTDLRRPLLEAWVVDFALPQYQELVNRAEALETAATALCASPSEDSLLAARDAWMDARQPWEEAEVFTFGPLLDFPLRLLPVIEFRPTRPEAVEGILTGEQALTLEAVHLLGAPARGFPALEVLLFTAEPAAFMTDGRRCDYLSLVAADLIANATLLVEAWSPTGGNYQSQLVDAGAGSEAFMSLQEGVAKVVNRMWQHVEKIREIELGKPAGLDGGPMSDEGVESRFSGRSIVDITDTLVGISAVYEGVGEGLGLRDLIAAQGKDFDVEFRTRLDAGVDAVEAIGDPLTTAVFERVDAVQNAVDVLAELQRLIQVDIMGALSLSLSFNDSDGD